MNSEYVNHIRSQRTGDKEAPWPKFLEHLMENRNLEIVKVDWSVVYDEISHAIVIQYEIAATTADTYMLQVWVMDQDDGIWIPELHPWNECVVEFSADQRITHFKGALVDHKWRSEDSGRPYTAYLWGFVDELGKTIQFGPFTEKFTYP